MTRPYTKTLSIMPIIRILHFSDFHLDGKHIEEAKSLLRKMINVINKDFHDDKQVDLVIFSGDMINKGGHDFRNIDEAFNSFLYICINPLLTSLHLNKDRFFFTIGNHDLHLIKDDEVYDNGLASTLTSEKAIKAFVDERQDNLNYLSRQSSFISFRDKFYKEFTEDQCQLTPFQSNFKIEVKGIKIGITSLNTSWRCCFNDKGRLVTGLWQIVNSESFLEGCDLKVAVGHHHPESMKDYEISEFLNLLSKNYDVYFSGHTHKSSTELRYREGWLMDVISPGALSGNIYEDRDPYKNGFQIVEIDTEKHNYDVTNYRAKDYDDFISQKEETKHIPQPSETKELEVAKKAAEESERKLRLLSQSKDIEPFEPIEKFIEEFKFTYEFISNKILDGIIRDFREESQNIRLLALSGMGKTRLIREAFNGNNQYNVFYTSSFNIEKALKEILNSHKTESGVIILDNCSHDTLVKAEGLIRNWNSKFRIISLYNDLSCNQQQCDGRLLILKYDQTADIVDSYLRTSLKIDNVEEKERLITVMKNYSGNIPYMAFMLVDSYKELGQIKIKNSDEILNNLLQNPSADELKVLEAISIFKLVGYKGNQKSEYELIKSENNIHHIMGKNSDELSYLFDRTIEKYRRKELIEELTQWIDVRPLPLAEWLVKRWFEETTSATLAGMFKRLAEDPKSGMLEESFGKRIEGIGNTDREKEIIKNVLLPDSGPFCNESIVVSSEGSRLILFMANVNQEAVSNSLFYLFRDKNTEYFYEKIKDKIRWNLSQALVKCCVRKESFYKAACILGRFAEAENEDYSNNATGLFCQFYHILLPGTEADFDQRIRVLNSLYKEGNRYYPLIIKAINNAFLTHDFIKDGNANKLGDIEIPDYKVKDNKDIVNYWEKCANILKDLIKDDSKTCNVIADMLTGHVRDFCWNGSVDILIDLIKFIKPHINGDWLKMRDDIHFVLDSDLCTRESDRLILKEWEEKLTPTDFLSRLQDTYQFKDSHLLINDTQKEFASECCLMQPFVDEFINKKLYTTDILGKLLDNNRFHNWIFCRLLSNSITKLLLGREFNKFVLAYINQKDKNYQSSFLLSVCIYNSKEHWVKELYNILYNNEYYALAISLMGLDDENLSNLDLILNDVTHKKYSSEYVKNYLRNSHFKPFSDILIICDKLYRNKNVDRIKVFYPYIVSHSFWGGDKHDSNYQNIKSKIIRYLIEYDFTVDNNYQNAHSVVQILEGYLKENNDPEFAKQFNQKIIKTLSNKYLANNPFEFSYFALLPKYEKAVMPDLLDALSLSNEQSGFYFQVMNQIGSGFGVGRGPLFQGNLDLIKKRCIQNPKILPIRLANICPVYKYEKQKDETIKEVRFSDFFYWLIEKFPNNADILEEFDANMNTISWSGVGSMAYIYQRKINCFRLLLDHKNKIVRDWAQRGIEQAQKEVDQERSRDDFHNVFYN